MALAGTKATSTALPRPTDTSVVLGDSTTSRSVTLWQTLKPFGWQGLLLVAVLIALYARVLTHLVDSGTPTLITPTDLSYRYYPFI